MTQAIREGWKAESLSQMQARRDRREPDSHSLKGAINRVVGSRMDLLVLLDMLGNVCCYIRIASCHKSKMPNVHRSLLFE